MTSIGPYLEVLASDAQSISRRVDDLKALSLDQLRWKPDPNSWSVLECMEHLVLTARAYHPVIRKALAGAQPTTSRKPYRPSLLGRMFIKSVSPDPRLKVKTLKMITPDRSNLTASVLDDLLSLLEERRILFAEAAETDLNRVKIRSPLNRLLRLSLGEALTVLVRHEERHLQQADRVQSRDGFPAANG